MIKAHELRIGNHVYLTNDNGQTIIDKIDAIDIYDCMVSEEKFNQSRQPIPITEELLIKAGFELQKGDWTIAKLKKDSGFIIHNRKEGKWRFTPIWCADYKTIDHLHQLQNLYHALTGEELIFEGLNQ
jgi:hypothetical protein